METQKVGVKFSYKKPEEEFYSLWIEDCAYMFDKKTAQEFVTHMKEQWPDLDYGATEEEKDKKPLHSYLKRTMDQWRMQNADELVNFLLSFKRSYKIEDKEFVTDECHKLIDAIIEALKEKNEI